MNWFKHKKYQDPAEIRKGEPETRITSVEEAWEPANRHDAELRVAEMDRREIERGNDPDLWSLFLPDVTGRVPVTEEHPHYVGVIQSINGNSITPKFPPYDPDAAGSNAWEYEEILNPCTAVSWVQRPDYENPGTQGELGVCRFRANHSGPHEMAPRWDEEGNLLQWDAPDKPAIPLIIVPGERQGESFEIQSVEDVHRAIRAEKSRLISAKSAAKKNILRLRDIKKTLFPDE